jgi:hypothetical protein
MECLVLNLLVEHGGIGRQEYLNALFATPGFVLLAARGEAAFILLAFTKQGVELIGNGPLSISLGLGGLVAVPLLGFLGGELRRRAVEAKLIGAGP